MDRMVDVACAHVEAPEVVVVVVVAGEEVVQKTPADELPRIQEAPVCVFEAVVEGEIHVMAAVVVVIELHTMDNSAVHEKSVAQVGEGRAGASWMPKIEWEDSQREVEGRAVKRAKQRLDSLDECQVDSKKGHLGDQHEAVPG